MDHWPLFPCCATLANTGSSSSSVDSDFMEKSDGDSGAGVGACADGDASLGVAPRSLRSRLADDCNISSFKRGRFGLGVLDGDRWLISRS